jgi:hypothetical protein
MCCPFGQFDVRRPISSQLDRFHAHGRTFPAATVNVTPPSWFAVGTAPVIREDRPRGGRPKEPHRPRRPPSSRLAQICVEFPNGVMVRIERGGEVVAHGAVFVPSGSERVEDVNWLAPGDYVVTASGAGRTASASFSVKSSEGTAVRVELK